jgi:hypothetical protein
MNDLEGDLGQDITLQGMHPVNHLLQLGPTLKASITS